MLMDEQNDGTHQKRGGGRGILEISSFPLSHSDVAVINACAKLIKNKSKMAGNGDREMVLANFQVDLFLCRFTSYLCSIMILLLSFFFQSITGIENLDECITLLDHHNWDLEVGSGFFPTSLHCFSFC